VNLSKEARQALREYKRKWRAENKDRIKKYNERYWERRAARMLAENGKNLRALEQKGGAPDES